MMKKKIFSYLMIVLVIVVSYFYAHIDKNVYLYNRNTDTSIFYTTGILEKNENLEQSFHSNESQIDGINIKVVLVGNVADIKLHCTILDENNQEVSSTSILASELNSNKFNKIKIPAINNAKGKAYTLVLTEENSDEQNGIGFYVEPKKQSEQQFFVKGNEVDGTLVTRVISHRFDVETFVVLLGMLAFIGAFMKVLYKYFK